MIVLDTHAWVWFVDAPRRLPKAARQVIERADRIGVPTMSVFEFVQLVERRRITLDVPVRTFEFVQLVERRRITLDVPVRTWVREALARDRVESLPLTAEVALDAAQLRFEGNPADRIIYATARAAGAQLVTRDERLREFDPELTVW